MSTLTFDERQQRLRLAKRAVACGALGTASGVAVSMLGAEGIGMVLTLGCGALLGWGLHRFGRLGPDPPG
jgi:hypothetical protein